MTKIAVAFALTIAVAVGIHAADHVWQHGIWRDVRVATAGGGAISVPVGGTPPTTVAGVTIPGTAPTYFSFPMTADMEYLTIDSPDGMRYVARSVRHLKGIIVNDPVDFAVEGENVFVRGPKPNQTSKLRLVSTTRLEKAIEK